MKRMLLTDWIVLKTEPRLHSPQGLGSFLAILAKTFRNSAVETHFRIKS